MIEKTTFVNRDGALVKKTLTFICSGSSLHRWGGLPTPSSMVRAEMLGASNLLTSARENLKDGEWITVDGLKQYWVVSDVVS